MPLLNPDGHVKVEQGQDWRKNTKLYPGQDEFNKGVDLNRNYGFRWNDCGITPIEKTIKCRVRTDPTSGSYIGPGPFSEAETQAIRDLANDTAKVDGFTFSLSWHTSGGEILYPWGYTENAPYRHEQDKELFETGARILQDAIAQARDARGEPAEGYDIIHPFRYFTAGTSDDWYYGEKGIFAYTIEAYGEEEGNPEPPMGFLTHPLSIYWTGSYRTISRQAWRWLHMNLAIVPISQSWNDIPNDRGRSFLNSSGADAGVLIACLKSRRTHRFVGRTRRSAPTYDIPGDRDTGTIRPGQFQLDG